MPKKEDWALTTISFVIALAVDSQIGNAITEWAKSALPHDPFLPWILNALAVIGIASLCFACARHFSSRNNP